MPRRIYLDYNASAPLLPQAREAMAAALDLTGNPSSVHTEGRRQHALIEMAREAVASLVGARTSEVVFTSGATEANVWALSGHWDEGVVAEIEHESVLAPLRSSGAHVTRLPVASTGVVDIAAAAPYLARAPIHGVRRVLALQLANNETGVIQPVAALAEIARVHGFAVHTDAVQAVGRIPVDFASLGVDTMAVSAHKFGGPKGIGALIVRDGFDPAPLLRGGGQERRRRAGTENVAAIAGFGAAARVAASHALHGSAIGALRDRLEAGLLQSTPSAVVIGGSSARLDNTLCIGVRGGSSEVTVIRLDTAGFAVSAGSACSSGRVGSSHVLAAMGVDPAVSRGAVRISLGPETTAQDVDDFIAAWRTLHGPRSKAPPRLAPVFDTGGPAFAAASATGE